MAILFYGDPHGNWRNLFLAVKEYEPNAVVILGDCDLVDPFRETLKRVFDVVPKVHWIPGNHDCDKLSYYQNLFGDFPAGNLHARYEQLDGKLVAGIGGVYKERVWSPRFIGGDNKPIYHTRKDYLRQVKKADRFENGLPLSQRATIFPEDHLALERVTCEILVTHEAPTSHRHGFIGIDALAHQMRTQIVIHGHHHESYVGKTKDGILVKGLGQAEAWLYEDISS